MSHISRGKPLEISSSAIFTEAGKLARIRGLARDVTSQVRASQRQAILVRELDHRVKNALARMAVVINVSRDRHQTLDEYVKVIQGRIASMARTQERLSRSKWEGVDLEVLVADELAPYRTAANCRIDGPSQLLDPDTAQAFAFTLHELATNAAKYGALSKTEGKVEVVWSTSGTEGKALELTWRETSPAAIEPPREESYGLHTIRNLLQYESGADVAVDFGPHGLICQIKLKLPMSSEIDLAKRAALNPREPSVAPGPQ